MLGPPSIAHQEPMPGGLFSGVSRPIEVAVRVGGLNSEDCTHGQIHEKTYRLATVKPQATVHHTKEASGFRRSVVHCEHNIFLTLSLSRTRSSHETTCYLFRSARGKPLSNLSFTLHWLAWSCATILPAFLSATNFKDAWQSHRIQLCPANAAM